MTRLALGKLGESIACDFLESRGYKILERNFRSLRWGEIDIVAKDGDTLVFVEVKTRKSHEFGRPEEAVNFYKLRSLKRAAYYYKKTHPLTPEPLRIDVVSVFLDPKTLKPLKIKLFKNIAL